MVGVGVMAMTDVGTIGWTVGASLAEAVGVTMLVTVSSRVSINV